jgi:hypothetical protein
MLVIKLSIQILYVAKEKLKDHLHDSDLERIKNRKFQWQRGWEDNVLMWWNVLTYENHKWACFKKCFEETPKYDKWHTHTQLHDAYSYIYYP